MPRVSRSEFEAIRRKVALRKAKRMEKRKAMSGGRLTPGRSEVKKAIVHLLGLLDAKRNGKVCKIHLNHPGEVAYHLVPQQRGDAARFDPDNVVWACRAANSEEVNNRSLYREKHIRLFGRDRIERLEEIARKTVQFGTQYLLELRDRIKKELEK